MLPTTLPNFNFFSIAAINVGSVVSTGLKIALIFFIIAYVLFSFFLYLRIRILSLTITTPAGFATKTVALLHFFIVLGLAIFLGLLLLF